MAIFILFVFLTGVLLGMRFKILFLIPIIGLAVIATLWVGILHADSASAILLSAVLAWGALQLGYFCGAVTRYRIALSRVRHPRKVLLHANQPPWTS
jgi:hypothetical protein